MSILKVDTINEKTSGNGVAIPGHVIQTVHQPYATSIATSSTSFVTTGHSLTITPKKSSSKILISVQGGSWYVSAGQSRITLYRGGSNLLDANGLCMNDAQPYVPHSFVYYDTSNTTSAITYTAYFKIDNSSNTTYYAYPGYGKMGMTATEIAQ